VALWSDRRTALGRFRPEAKGQTADVTTASDKHQQQAAIWRRILARHAGNFLVEVLKAQIDAEPGRVFSEQQPYGVDLGNCRCGPAGRRAAEGALYSVARAVFSGTPSISRRRGRRLRVQLLSPPPAKSDVCYSGLWRTSQPSLGISAKRRCPCSCRSTNPVA
jgi:hypothetical protein